MFYQNKWTKKPMLSWQSGRKYKSVAFLYIRLLRFSYYICFILIKHWKCFFVFVTETADNVFLGTHVSPTESDQCLTDRQMNKQTTEIPISLLITLKLDFQQQMLYSVPDQTYHQQFLYVTSNIFCNFCTTWCKERTYYKYTQKKQQQHLPDELGQLDWDHVSCRNLSQHLHQK